MTVQTRRLPFNLSASGVMNMPAGGGMFKVLSATGPIRVIGDDFDIICEAGQGLRKPFTRLIVQDVTGAANAGGILIGDTEFIDDRVTGTVDVNDANKSSVLAGSAFMGYVGQAAVVGQYAEVQLWNPSAAVLVIVEAIHITPGAAGVPINISRRAAALTAASNATNKLLGSAVSTGQLRSQSSVAPATASGLGYLIPPTTALITLQPKRPIVLPQNTGIGLHNETVNTQLNVTFEFSEESVT